jgi:hypothetical protein
MMSHADHVFRIRSCVEITSEPESYYNDYDGFGGWSRVAWNDSYVFFELHE